MRNTQEPSKLDGMLSVERLLNIVHEDRSGEPKVSTVRRASSAPDASQRPGQFPKKAAAASSAPGTAPFKGAHSSSGSKASSDTGLPRRTEDGLERQSDVAQGKLGRNEKARLGRLTPLLVVLTLAIVIGGSLAYYVVKYRPAALLMRMLSPTTRRFPKIVFTQPTRLSGNVSILAYTYTNVPSGYRSSEAGITISQ